MTNDHQDHTDTNSTNTDTPPDRAASGDVSTTGVSSHDVQGHGNAADMDHGDDHSGHGGHGGHGPDTSDVPTLVPTTWKELALPALVVVIVAILLIGPISNAFSSRPVSVSSGEHMSGGTTEGEGGAPSGSEQNAEPATGGAVATATRPAVATQTTGSTATAVSVVAPTSTEVVAVANPSRPDYAPTQTAVALAGASGNVARMPVEIDFEGASFVVKAGDTLLPDWKPATEASIATWINGTVANHILYIPYSDANAALFSKAKTGDIVRMTMNTGQVFEFAVANSQRAQNGPATDADVFTVSDAMTQDHAGVTLFLTGDPSPDRAVVQADFTGNIVQPAALGR